MLFSASSIYFILFNTENRNFRTHRKLLRITQWCRKGNKEYCRKYSASEQKVLKIQKYSNADDFFMTYTIERLLSG